MPTNTTNPRGTLLCGVSHLFLDPSNVLEIVRERWEGKGGEGKQTGKVVEVIYSNVNLLVVI